jgi:hypothetical protein
MKNILIGVSMVIALLANLFFCFWLGNIFLSKYDWFTIPSVVALFVWFFAVALVFACVAENMTTKGKS